MNNLQVAPNSPPYIDQSWCSISDQMSFGPKEETVLFRASVKLVQLLKFGVTGPVN